MDYNNQRIPIQQGSTGIIYHISQANVEGFLQLLSRKSLDSSSHLPFSMVSFLCAVSKTSYQRGSVAQHQAANRQLFHCHWHRVDVKLAQLQKRMVIFVGQKHPQIIEVWHTWWQTWSFVKKLSMNIDSSDFEGDKLWSYMGVEPKIGVKPPQIIHLFIGFPYKPSILGETPYFWKHPYFY